MTKDSQKKDKIFNSQNVRNSRFTTLTLGIAVGSMCTASIIALFLDNMSITSAHLVLGIILLSSFCMCVFWAYKNEITKKVTGVELKTIPDIVNELGRNVTDGEFRNIKDRAYEIAVVWSSIKVRMSFLSTLVFLATTLFLMLNAYVMLRQEILMKENIRVIKEHGKNQIELMEQNAEVLREQKEIVQFQVNEEIIRTTLGSHNERFDELLNSLDNCRVLWVANGGNHTYQDINNYLALIDDLGIYESKGIISLDRINDTLGYYILRFMNNNSGEMYKYINVTREHWSDSFYKHLEGLVAKLEGLEENQDLIGNIEIACKHAIQERIE